MSLCSLISKHFAHLGEEKEYSKVRLQEIMSKGLSDLHFVYVDDPRIPNRLPPMFLRFAEAFENLFTLCKSYVL